MLSKLILTLLLFFKNKSVLTFIKSLNNPSIQKAGKSTQSSPVSASFRLSYTFQNNTHTYTHKPQI